MRKPRPGAEASTSASPMPPLCLSIRWHFAGALAQLVLNFVAEPAAVGRRDAARTAGPAACWQPPSGISAAGWSISACSGTPRRGSIPVPGRRATSCSPIRWAISKGSSAVAERRAPVDRPAPSPSAWSFGDFEDYWRAAAAGPGPVGSYVEGLDPALRELIVSACARLTYLGCRRRPAFPDRHRLGAARDRPLDRLSFRPPPFLSVIPAKAGIQGVRQNPMWPWIPVFAEMTKENKARLIEPPGIGRRSSDIFLRIYRCERAEMPPFPMQARSILEIGAPAPRTAFQMPLGDAAAPSPPRCRPAGRWPSPDPHLGAGELSALLDHRHLPFDRRAAQHAPKERLRRRGGERSRSAWSGGRPRGPP